jgi:tight adherence protein B
MTVEVSVLPLMTFLAVAAAIMGVYSLVSDLYLRDRSRISQRVNEEFRRLQRNRIQQSRLFKNLGHQLTAEISVEDEDKPSLRHRFEAMVEQSGLDLTLGKLLAISAVAGLAPGALCILISRRGWPGVILATIGAGAPLLYVRFQRKVRLEKLLAQLPDAFDLLARVIRAGQTLSQGMQAVATEFSPPLADEFGYCYEQQNLGLPPEIAYRDLARRTGLLEIKIFVLAMLVHQQTGGNLAELVEKLAAVIRDRSRIRGQIRTLTAESRMQAAILLALPPFMFLILVVMNRDYAFELVEHPNLIIWSFVSQAIGAVWIRKLVNFDF